MKSLHFSHKYLTQVVGIYALLIVSFSSIHAQTDWVSLVEPRMGTDSEVALSNGNTYPAIGMPWGMNYWTPQTNKMGDGWCYQYDANKINGFKQTHQPSPWMNDYGQFAIMPTVDQPGFKETDRQSWFSHKTEIVEPNYYSVYLADYDVTSEFTTSERCALFRFTFPETEEAAIVIDAQDRGSYVKLIPEENKIIGYSTRYARGNYENFKMYFVIECSEAWTSSEVWKDSVLVDAFESNGNHAGVRIAFSTKSGQTVNLRVASSFISWEQAELSLQREIGNQSFDNLRQKGRDEWNKQLGKIEVADGTDQQRRTFYSCLYRSLLFPNRLYEINEAGEAIHWSPYDSKIHPGKMFAGTGFWDTFRALYPFLNLMYPEINAEMQEGLANCYKEGGWLPEWSSPGYANIMIGNNSASVVSDAYLKGVGGKDINTLYEALLHGATNEGPMDAVGRRGAPYYLKLGYVPYDVGINESAARTLEYAYDDFCIYQLGKKLNRPKKELKIYRERAMNYKHLYDPESGWMRGKNEDGSFQSPFNPYKWGDAFTEGNSLHYSWSVFHDVQGLIGLMGGKEAFVSKLDEVFATPPIFDDSYYGGTIHEIREMQLINMGQYAHGNQPIQHMIYLYNYAGAPWKAQYWSRQVMDRLYQPTPDGYCGDEDNGQTSAWYVFSALGFYPVCPATDEYVLGSPLFGNVTLHLPEGKKLEIRASNNASEHPYVQELKMNGVDYSKNYVLHSSIIQGGILEFTMGGTPNTQRGINAEDFPYSLSAEK